MRILFQFFYFTKIPLNSNEKEILSLHKIQNKNTVNSKKIIQSFCTRYDKVDFAQKMASGKMKEVQILLASSVRRKTSSSIFRNAVSPSHTYVPFSRLYFLFMDFYHAGDEIASFFLRMIEIPKQVLLPSYLWSVDLFFSLFESFVSIKLKGVLQEHRQLLNWMDLLCD